VPDQDIFDKVAAKMGKGDIFDRVAAQMPAGSGIPGAPNGLPPMPGSPAAPGKPMTPPLNAAQMSFGTLGGNIPTQEQAAGINAALPQVPGIVSDIRKTALAAGGASLGSGAVAAGKGLLPPLLRMAGAGAGAATGNVTGSAISGQMPNATEAAKTGAAFAGAQGAGEALGPFVRWLTSSKTTGAQLLQQASAKAGNAVVELSPKTNALVDDIIAEGKSGGHPPKVVTDLLFRVGPHTRVPAEAPENPLTYDEARRFQGNASSLSRNEYGDLKGRMASLVPQFAKSFSADVQAAADKAGIGTEHAAGMREYAMASARNRTLAKGAKIAGLGGAGYLAEQGIKKGIEMVKP